MVFIQKKVAGYLLDHLFIAFLLRNFKFPLVPLGYQSLIFFILYDAFFAKLVGTLVIRVLHGIPE